MNKFFLRIIKMLSPLWDFLGVDKRQLYLILDVKLKMDERRPSTYQSIRRRSKSKLSSTWSNLIVSLLMGVFFMLLLMTFTDLLIGLTFFFSAFIVLLSLTMISDFTSVLIDVRDNFIIIPRPVSDKTFVVARISHIAIYISRIMLPMALPGAIYILINNGLGGFLLLLLLVIVTMLLTIFLVNLVYLLILRITTPQKFKEIINYFQIAFVIFIFAAYQLFPRMMDNPAVRNINLAEHSWVYFTPPFWLATCWHMIMAGDYSSTNIILSCIALLLPFIAIWVVVRFLAPTFNRKLSGISTASSEDNKTDKVSKRRNAGGLSQTLSKAFNKTSIGRAGFRLGWQVTGRSREFKLKTYPAFGYVLVYLGIILFQSKGDLAAKVHHFQQIQGYIILIYFCSFASINATHNLAYSDKYQAAWLYYSTPLKNPGELMAGVLKATIIKYFLPFYLLISALAMALNGIAIIPDLILGLINNIVISVLIAFIYFRYLPFSQSWNIRQSSGRFMKNLVLMAGVFAIGALHYFVAGNLIVIAILTVLMAIAAWLLIDKFSRLQWREIRE